MKLSTRARYSLRACFALAKAAGEVVSLSELSKQTEVSEKYLEQLLGKLKAGGIVVAHRGAKGGYKLGESVENITIGSIFHAVNELDISNCEGSCKDEYCPNRKIFVRLQKYISDLLDNISLCEFVKENSCDSTI